MPSGGWVRLKMTKPLPDNSEPQAKVGIPYVKYNHQNNNLGLWIPLYINSGIQVLDSGFFVSRTWIPHSIVIGILDPLSCIGFQSLWSRIPQAKISRIPESELFPYTKRNISSHTVEPPAGNSYFQGPEELWGKFQSNFDQGKGYLVWVSGEFHPSSSYRGSTVAITSSLSWSIYP